MVDHKRGAGRNGSYSALPSSAPYCPVVISATATAQEDSGTQRVSGSGPYRAEAHATLIKGDSYEDEQVFSGHTHSCATVNVVNRTARTCASPKFRTSPGDKWFAISGHSYDRGNDGSVEESIAGELDFVWTAPSS